MTASTALLALGLDTFPVYVPMKKLPKSLHKLAAGGYGIIYITEALGRSVKT